MEREWRGALRVDLKSKSRCFDLTFEPIEMFVGLQRDSGSGLLSSVS
jgi:hypothetical protein